MGNLSRLERIVRSWTGKLTRQRKYYYSAEEARLILAELGMQMRPEVFTFMTDDYLIREEFVQQIHESEEALGFAIVKEEREIHPDLNPRVYEEGGKVIFTITWKDKERIFAELTLPKHIPPPPAAEEKPAEEKKEPTHETPEGGGPATDIPIL